MTRPSIRTPIFLKIDLSIYQAEGVFQLNSLVFAKMRGHITGHGPQEFRKLWANIIITSFFSEQMKVL